MMSVDPDAHAVHIQRVVRGFLGRLAALRQANLVYEKIWDPKTHAYYYYNTYTFETTWQPPTLVTRILGEFGDLEKIAPTYTEEEAAVMMQAAWRRRLGLRAMRAVLASVVSKVFDESTGAYYYLNNLTGETSWSKPALFGSEDVESYPPKAALTDGGDYAEQLGNGSHGFDRSQGGGGQEPWTTEQQQQHRVENADGATVVEAGYEGWVWDDTSGWYYDEDLAAQQLLVRSAEGLPTNEKPANADEHDSASEDGELQSGSDSSSSSTWDEDEADAAGNESRKRRRKRRRRSLAPRNYPRSKAQRLVDEAEDSVEGTRPESLDLSELDMDRVTSRVYQLDWLQKLNLSHNRLTRISPDLAEMEGLVDVDFRHNRIQAVPDDLEALTNLKHLRLSHNRLRGFRGNIYLISSLETLDLGHNRLKEVPVQVGDLQLLKRTREWEIGLRLLQELVYLDVSYNRLKQWPPQVEECGNLRDLRLCHNKLQEVPGVIGDNTALTNLDLSSNSLKELPEAVNFLSGLTHLNVADNKLKVNPILPVGRKQRGRLVSLEVLQLERNNLTEGPASVETLKTLTDLNVSNNPIKSWVPDVSILRKMKYLRLRSVGLNQCPEGIGHLNKLEVLDLSDNDIDTLNQSAASLFKLTRLDLSGNNIPDLGSCIGNMVSLTHLDVSGNGLEQIGPELSRCERLTFLDLSDGTVEHLPEEFSKLSRLRVLRAQGNKLRVISHEFESLTALEELILGGNRLRTLPSSLHTLKKMHFVELSRNAMELIPPVTQRWPKLTHMVLSGNPLKDRRRQALELLLAAQRGHDAMHGEDWEKATRFLGVAADAYHDAINMAPDFPDPNNKGLPLAKTRPHDMVSFHHVNLGVAHLYGAREAAKKMQDMEKAEVSGDDGGTVGSLSAESMDSTEVSSTVTLSTRERDARRQREQQYISLRKSRDQHYHAATTAFNYADQLERLSRPVGRSVGVWLGRAAVAADMGKAAAALDDLERALVGLRKSAKIRALLAESRIELGQYERGITDCDATSRLLEVEERRLEEKQAEQERKMKEAAAQEAKLEAIRRTEERLAVWERQAAEAQAEQFAAAEREKTALLEVVAGTTDAAGAPEEDTVVEGKTDQPSVDGVADEAEEAALAAPNASTTATAVEKAQEGGSEQAEIAVASGEHAENLDRVNLTTGGSGETLPAIAEEATETELGTDGLEITVDKESDEQGESKRNIEEMESKEYLKDHSMATESEQNSSSQGDLKLQERYGDDNKAEPHENHQGTHPEGTADTAAFSLGGGDGMNSRTGNAEAEANPARQELVKQRKQAALLLQDAKNGMSFLRKSVDMADVLRGFVFNQYGVPVRDPAIARELLRDGRSAIRDRHRRLMAVEAAKRRQRSRDAELMKRSFRQAAARQKSAKIAKARKAAAMAIYRDVEEAWERQQEEQEEKRRIEAAKRKIEQEVLAAAEEEAYNLQMAPESGGGKSSGVSSESVVPGAPAAVTSSASTSAPADAKKVRHAVDEDDEEDEDDPELRKVLARRAGVGGKKTKGRRR